MEGITVPFFIVAGICIIGAIIETYIPGFITETVQSNMKSLTIAMIGILFSFLLLFALLRLRIREGFEDSQLQTRWDSLVTTNKIEEICSLYTDIYDKIVTVEKGAPSSETKTDAQAREATDARFAQVMKQKPLSCSLFKEVQDKKGNINTFYPVLLRVPDIFFVQAYETANACLLLLIDQYNQVQDAERKRKEGFEDLCDEKQAEERREYLKQMNPNEEYKKCILPEEVPEDKKQTAMEQKLTRLEDTWSSYKKTIKSPISKVLEDCAYYKGELEKKKKEAEELSNKYNLKS